MLGKGLAVLGGVLYLGLSISIIVITAVHLSGQWLYLTAPNQVVGTSQYFYFQCCLGSEYWERILCNYAYCVGAFGITFSLATCALAVMPGGVSNAGLAGASGFGAVWWIIAASVFTANSCYADDAWHTTLPSGVPQNNWRHSIFAMCWAVVLLCICIPLFALIGRNSEEDRSERKDVEMHEPPVKPVA